MSNRAADVLRVAAGEIGYYAPSDPEPGSKYGRWLASKWNQSWLAGPSTSIWWCMLFVSWCFEQAGASFGSLPSYNTDVTVSNVRAGKGGSLLSNVRAAQAGDIVIFDWNKNTAATDHVGIVEKNCGSYIQTIEGNTSGSDWGSQSAGNGVHRRTRSWDCVRYVIRPPYGAGTGATVNNYSGNETLEVDGYWGYATTKKAQTIAGTPVDGEIWGQNPDWRSILLGCTLGWKFTDSAGSAFIKWLQANRLGVEADGIFGPASANAFIHVYGNDVQDGRLDAPSTAIKGFQAKLNGGSI